MDVLRDHPLKTENTLGLPARAAHFCRVRSESDLIQSLDLAKRDGLQVLVLGGGSNLILTRDWPGLVVQVALPGVEEVSRTGERITLRVAAGQDWPALVERCLEAGWYGLENLALIPGTAGAAPVQNIGAYGLELSDRLVKVEALERATGNRAELSPGDCRFGYRDSIFKGLAKDRYLAHCGIYVFTPEIFDCISELSAEGQANGETGLTEAQQLLLRRHPNDYYLHLVAGVTMDTGSPAGYVDAFERMRVAVGSSARR